ncbi:MAG: glycosyltransferase, partial [Bacteroidaceae bacterium]|nr:glycosyltransferase [Bacteroidaceae bacterium]
MYLSVIVPVYNCTHYIDRCIESIVSQSFKEIELILPNDVRQLSKMLHDARLDVLSRHLIRNAAQVCM